MPGSDSARRGVVRPDRIRGIVAQWPLILVMVAVWCALWQDFAPHVALTGLAFALLIIGLFPMPSIPFSGRLNPCGPSCSRCGSSSTSCAPQST